MASGRKRNRLMVVKIVQIERFAENYMDTFQAHEMCHLQNI